MNEIANRLEPYLNANAISFTRNTPNMTAGSSIAQSNEGQYDLHLSLHSNAAPQSRYGQVRGSDMYYSPGSVKGQQMANHLVEHLRDVYPLPNRVRIVPTTTIGEVTKTRAPAVLAEIAYHDNEDDANWIIGHMDQIALAIAFALADYFEIPFVWPVPAYQTTVALRDGTLNIRSGPGLEYPIIGSAYKDQPVMVLGRLGNWFTVQSADTLGFVDGAYLAQ